jgi:3-oxoacyl-[acyl-carrier protein] reductase
MEIKLMNHDFSGKVALVIGAGRGIGRSIALLLAQCGARVSLVDRGDYVSEVESEIIDKGGEAASFQVDISNGRDVGNMVDSVIDRFEKIDFLANNAGIFRLGYFKSITEEQWNETIQNNLNGCFLVTKAVLPHMREQQSGSIVNTSSIFAFDNVAGYAAYNASKAAINSLTVTLAKEVARHNIRVNAVAPGAIDTPLNKPLKSNEQMLEKIISLIPMRRLGKPEEIAKAVAFLLSDDASYITGHVLWVTGGYRNPF